MGRPRSMTDLEQVTWDLLREQAVGRGCAIDQYALGLLLGLSGRRASVTRRVQVITKALRDEFGLPVCASSREPAGVYIPLTLDEGQEAVANMLSRGWETIRSGRKLRAALLRFCGQQRPLHLLNAPDACTEGAGVGEASLCAWCGDVFKVTRAGQEFCQAKDPLCRDRFWAEARRLGAAELRDQNIRRAS